MQEPNLMVAIMHGKEISFELYGEYHTAQVRGVFKGKYIVRLVGNKIIITSNSQELTVDDGITFLPSDFDTASFLLKDVVIGIQFHWEKKENQRFLGALKFIIEDGQLTAINLIPVENYLTSVICSEMSATSSEELLKAHSIISRSWILAQIEKTAELKGKKKEYVSFVKTDDEIIRWYDREDHSLYDVCADDHCQRYQGITRLHAHNAQNAVAFTRGLVIKYEDKICDARFSKSCGGISEAFENVWEPVKHPYLRSVVDYKYEPEGFDLDLTNEKAANDWILKNPIAFCNTQDEKVLSQVLVEYDQNTTDFYRWKLIFTQKEISGILHEKSGIDFGNIIDLVPVKRGYSGRLIKLKVIGTKKTYTFGKELEIRRIFSKSHLYSSAFIIEKENIVNKIPEKFIFYGAGWGHGVGLCQIGAAVMGEMGYTFDEILLHYFRGAEITNIYD
ncbi:SpoIID/LytB domain-containing protein [Bacteroidota bacterium]